MKKKVVCLMTALFAATVLLSAMSTPAEAASRFHSNSYHNKVTAKKSPILAKVQPKTKIQLKKH